MTVLSVIAVCQAGQLATPLAYNAPFAYNSPLAYSAPLSYSAPLTAAPLAYSAAAAPFAYSAPYAAGPLAYSNGLAYTSQYINQPAYAPLARSLAYTSPVLANAPYAAAYSALPAVSAPIVSLAAKRYQFK